MSVLWKTLLATAVLSFATAAHAEKTIGINFDSTANFKESDGVNGMATKSGLTADQRKKILAIVQKEYDDALGPGVIKVKEGAGDVNLTVTGSQAPGKLKGKEYGDAGKPGKTGVVHGGEFKKGGFKDDGLINGIAETAAHEAGHKLGIGEHNSDKPPSKMTRGDLLNKADREAGGRKFTDHDIKKLKKDLGIASAEQKEGQMKGDLGVFVGHTLVAANTPDDRYLDALAGFDGLVGMDFGYVTSGGDFVWEGDWEDQPYPGFLTFIYSAGANLAVSYLGQVYSLENGGAHFTLSDINPFNSRVYRRAAITFDTAGGPATLNLDAGAFDSTGGFRVVPEPEAWMLMLMGFGLAGATLRRRRALQAAA